MKKVFVTAMAVSVLMGCTGTSGPKQTGGTIIGGVAGAAIGSQFGGSGAGRAAGAAIGALTGALVGGAIGGQMDARDKQLANRAAYNAFEHYPDNRASSWRNPNNNHRGHTTVTRTVENPSSNLVCRDFVQTVNIGGQQEKAYGRACRDMRDVRGEWKIQR